MGRELYRQDTAFRDAIHRYSRVVEEHAGFNVADLIVNPMPATSDGVNALERRHIILLVAFEIALSESWRANGVEPSAVMGACSGEISAAFAAGALTLEESAAVACSVADVTTQRFLPGHFITLDLEFGDALDLSARAPAPLDVSFEISPQTTLAYCSQADFDAVHQFLTGRGVTFRAMPCDWPHHTSRTGAPGDIADRLFIARPQPLGCGLYSTVAGGLIPPGTVLDWDYWYQAAVSPGRFGRMMRAALHDGYDTFLNVSANPALKMGIKQTAAMLTREFSMLDTMRHDEPEPSTFGASLESLRAAGLVHRLGPPAQHPTTATHRDAIDATGVSLIRPDVRQNPYPHYAALRRIGPVHYLHQHGFWLVLNYQDVVDGLRRPDIFDSSPGNQLDPVLLSADPPAHTRARRIMAPYLAAPAMQALEDYTRRSATRMLLDGRRAREFDVVCDLAAPLTEIVVGRFMGLGNDECAALQQNVAPHRDRLDVVVDLVDEWARAHVARAPQGDGERLCDRLRRGAAPEALTADEIPSVLKLLWIAGTTTTRMLIASSVLLLLKHPAIRRALQTDLALVPSFVEEVLRFDAPEQMAWRMARQDLEIAGTRIPAGADVRFSLGAANHDPAHFDEPDVLRLRRTPNDHLAFAAGPHYCLGASLARMEARVAIETLLTGWPDFRAASHLATIWYVESLHFRALQSLRISAT